MKKAFTLMELLMVVLILGLLATLAVGIFSTQVERARFAKARLTIATLELAINRYQIDLGQYPPSGTQVPTGPQVFQHNGLLHLTLVHSFSGDQNRPASPRWQGPYIDVKDQELGNSFGQPIDESGFSLMPGEYQILDPWRTPYRYVRCCGSTTDNYSVNNGTELPSTSAFAVTETYYNPSTFQIISFGRNGTTLPAPNMGLDDDDVTNFGQ